MYVRFTKVSVYALGMLPNGTRVLSYMQLEFALSFGIFLLSF